MAFQPNPMGGFMFDMVPAFIMIVFVIVIGGIIFNIIKGVGQWKYNNEQPVLTVAAKIVGKRTDIQRHLHSNHNQVGHHHRHTSTSYFITFQVESGDRMEMRVGGKEYGLLAENDEGFLTFQGTRYHGFERKRD